MSDRLLLGRSGNRRLGVARLKLENLGEELPAVPATPQRFVALEMLPIDTAARAGQLQASAAVAADNPDFVGLQFPDVDRKLHADRLTEPAFCSQNPQNFLPAVGCILTQNKDRAARARLTAASWVRDPIARPGRGRSSRSRATPRPPRGIQTPRPR